MTYTAKYQRPGGLFWKTIRGIVGDTCYVAEGGQALPVRVLFLEDKTRVELPMSMIIRFSPERFESIRAKMSREAGQRIEV